MKRFSLFLTLFISILIAACKNTDLNSNKVETISLTRASAYLGDDSYTFVDLRSVDEYIGWPMGIKREGHIKGAIDFPENWFNLLISNKELERELTRREITTESNLILYNRDGDYNNNIVDRLSALGYSNISFLEGGIRAWANDTPLPMEKLKNYSTYVYPGWIEELQAGKDVDNYDGRPYILLEVSYRQKPAGQLPNSIHIDDSLNHLRGERNFLKYKDIPLEIKSKYWNKPSNEKIGEILLSLGITKDTMVILYGPNLLATNRCAAVMKYAGVEDIRILNGGTKRLEIEEYPLVKGYSTPIPAIDFGTNIPANPGVLIDYEEELAIVHSKDAVVASIRSWKEYIGEVTGYTYINDKGDIANSRFGHAGSDPYHMQDYRNIDNTMFNYKIIEKRWNQWGINNEKKVSFHCGTGWRASETYFYALAMGWSDIHIYDGGWYEWHMKNGPRKPFKSFNKTKDM